jgi:DNA-binding transcriptional ArsR family regulator
MLQTRPLPTNQDATMAQLFRALSDPTRLKLMCLLLEERDLCVGELAARSDISAPGTSQHLKLLELHGLAVRVRNGQKTCYQPNHDNPQAQILFDCIKTLKEDKS